MKIVHAPKNLARTEQELASILGGEPGGCSWEESFDSIEFVIEDVPGIGPNKEKGWIQVEFKSNGIVSIDHWKDRIWTYSAEPVFTITDFAKAWDNKEGWIDCTEKEFPGFK